MPNQTQYHQTKHNLYYIDAAATPSVDEFCKYKGQALVILTAKARPSN